MTLDQQICFSLYSATNAMIRSYRPILDELDLTYPQYLVMLALWEEEGIKVNQLSEKTRLDAGTLTPILKRLEAKGLLERRRSEQDERIRVLVLTQAGSQLRAQAACIPEKMLCQIHMADEQLRTLKQLSENLFKNLTDK